VLTKIDTKGDFAIVKCHHDGRVFEYQVHDLNKRKGPVVARFSTEEEAISEAEEYDFYRNVSQK